MANPIEIKPAPEWTGGGVEVFREVFASHRPAVMRGFAADWPAIRAGRDSAEAFREYLRQFDRGGQAELVVGDPAIQGKMFYRDDMSGPNFERTHVKVAEALDMVIASTQEAEPKAVYMKSAPAPEILPDFARENRIDYLDPRISPRIWIGNRITVVAHYDLYDNIAIVAAGRRRFTVFPPEQMANLYIGPIDHTVFGCPTSLVPLENPDFDRFPRFAEALESAVTCELEPGDAIFIPYYWWHHVVSLEPFNALINYWWNDAAPVVGSPFETLLHAIMTIRDMPPHQRSAWKAAFDHYVFQENGDPAAHIPPERRGVLGPLSRMHYAQIVDLLGRSMERAGRTLGVR